MKRNLEKLSNYTFYAGFLVAIYALYKVYVNNRELPPGVCPIENNRPMLIVAIVLLTISFLLSLIHDVKRNS